MNPAKWIGDAAGAILRPVSDMVTAGQKRKQARETGLQKIQKAQVDGQNSLQLSDSEWEAVNASNLDTTWKDEYVTVVCTSPYVLIIIGSLAAAFNAPQILEGAMQGVAKLEEIGIDVGHLAQVVVYAAVGLKLWRGK